MNMIEDVIKKGDLHLFLVGDGVYKCHGRSDYPDPTDFLACWEEEIIPYFNKNNSIESVMVLYDAIIMLFNYTKDVNLGLYSIASHIEWDYYFEKENLIRFSLDWKSIAQKLELAAEINKERLIADTRWAGAEWNSSQGLYEPICRVLSKLLSSSRSA